MGGKKASKKGARQMASAQKEATPQPTTQMIPPMQRRVGTCACGEEATNLCQFCKVPLWCSTACLVKDDGSHDPQCGSLLAARRTAREAPQVHAPKKTTAKAKGTKVKVVDEAKVAYYREEGAKLARMGRYEAAVVAYTHAIVHLDDRMLAARSAVSLGVLRAQMFGQRAEALLELDRPKLALADLQSATCAVLHEDPFKVTAFEQELAWKLYLTTMSVLCDLGLYNDAKRVGLEVGRELVTPVLLATPELVEVGNVAIPGLFMFSYRFFLTVIPAEKKRKLERLFSSLTEEINRKSFSYGRPSKGMKIVRNKSDGPLEVWPPIENRERFGCTRPSAYLLEKTADVSIHLSGAAGPFDVVVAALDWYMQEEPQEVAAQTWQEQMERMAAVAVEKRDGSLTLVVSGPVYEVMGPLLMMMQTESDEEKWLDSSLHLCFGFTHSVEHYEMFRRVMPEDTFLAELGAERADRRHDFHFDLSLECSPNCVHHDSTFIRLSHGDPDYAFRTARYDYFIVRAKEVLLAFRAILLSDCDVSVVPLEAAKHTRSRDEVWASPRGHIGDASLVIWGGELACITPQPKLRHLSRIVVEIQCCRGPALSEEEFVLFTGLSLEGMRRIYGYDVELRGGKGFFPTVLFIKRDIPKIESMEEVKELLAMVVRAYKVLVVQGPTLLDPSRGDKAVAYVSAADYVKVLVQLLEIPAATEALSKSLVEKAWAVTAELAMGQTEVFEYAISSYALVNEVGVHPVAYKLDVVPPCLLTSADEGGSFPLYDTKAYYAEVIYLVRSACVLTDFECWEEILNDASTEEVFAWLRERPPGDVSKIVGERVPDCDTSIFIRQSDYEKCGEDAILLRFDLEENAFLVNRLPPYEDVFV